VRTDAEGLKDQFQTNGKVKASKKSTHLFYDQPELRVKSMNIVGLPETRPQPRRNVEGSICKKNMIYYLTENIINPHSYLNPFWRGTPPSPQPPKPA
jgi:hypothetical protein